MAAEEQTKQAELPDVTLAHDTVTIGDKVTGLARVLVQRDAIILADDIADTALDAARGGSAAGSASEFSYGIRVVADPAGLTDLDVFRALEDRCIRLRARLDAYAPPEAGSHDKAPAAGRPLIAAVAGIGLLMKALGFGSQLLARDLQLSGREVDPTELGFDLDVAGALMRKTRDDEALAVEVDRVMPTPDSKIAAALRQLAEDAASRLAGVVSDAAVALARAEAAATADETAVTALDTQLVELFKGLVSEPQAHVDKALTRLEARRQELVDAAPQRAAETAIARERHAEGEALLKEIGALLTAAVTPETKGGLPALARAARGESLSSGGKTTHLLYVRLIAGGLDQSVISKIGADKWMALAGVTAEYAVLTPEGGLLASGVRSALQTSSMKVGDPSSFGTRRLNYNEAFERDPKL